MTLTPSGLQAANASFISPVRTVLDYTIESDDYYLYVDASVRGVKALMCSLAW